MISPGMPLLCSFRPQTRYATRAPLAAGQCLVVAVAVCKRDNLSNDWGL